MLKMFITSLKIIIRDRQSLFWMLMFPLMFMVIFGLFFGRSDNKAGTVALVSKSNTEIADNFSKGFEESGLFEINKTDNLEEAKKQVDKSKISAVIFIPEKFGSLEPDSSKQIEIYYDPANTQTSAILTGYIDKFLTQINYSIQKAEPIFSLKQQKAGSAQETTYFDFILAGILGMALMNSSIIGIAVGMTKYREDKILKRITTTPLKTWVFIVSQVAARLVINLAQISLILVVGIYGFHGHVYGNIFSIYAIALLGGLLFQLIGFSIASFAKTTQAAEGMATALTIPMMFLAGVFFPIDSLPKWLFAIVQYLPLAPLLRILRGVTLDGNSPFVNPINFAIVLGWIVITLIISIYKFRLSEE